MFLHLKKKEPQKENGVKDNGKDKVEGLVREKKVLCFLHLMFFVHQIVEGHEKQVCMKMKCRFVLFPLAQCRPWKRHCNLSVMASCREQYALTQTLHSTVAVLDLQVK